jgi:hypothetical protein
VLEGVLKGCLSAALAAALLVALTGVLQGRVPEVVALSAPALFAFLGFGAFLGGLGSVLSMQGYLRKW